MPFPFVPDMSARSRKDPLGPATLNQFFSNCDALDGYASIEHLHDGTHNAPEIPFVLGHVKDGATPTGYLFDTAFGGGTLARTSTGTYTANVAAGLIRILADGVTRRFSAMANVNDSNVATKPHIATIERASDTSIRVRVQALSSALGGGGGANSWAVQNRSIDLAVHAPQRDIDSGMLTSHLTKNVGDYLTEQSTDWNALVKSQTKLRQAQVLEHNDGGNHNVNRIARALALVYGAAGTYSIFGNVNIAGVSKISTGIVEVTTVKPFNSTDLMAAFPSAIPLANELVVANAYAYSTSSFRICIYAYSVAEGWARADRSFVLPMFGSM